MGQLAGARGSKEGSVQVGPLIDQIIRRVIHTCMRSKPPGRRRSGDLPERPELARWPSSSRLSAVAVTMCCESAGEGRILPDPEFRNTFGGWVVYDSARKHDVADEDAVHAADHAVVAYPAGEEDEPIRELRLGPDRAGNLLEIVVLFLDDGRAVIIHAMRMRRKYQGLLPGRSGGEEG
jgi:hypothetical protein